MNEFEKISAEIIQRNFDLQEMSGDAATMQHLRELLIEKLNYLLDHDFEKLLWILYRIDVSEQKAKQALSQESAEPPAAVLADLIIGRQQQKLITRMQFSNRPEQP